MTDFLELPMPGETFDGKIVVASIWITEDYDGGEDCDLTLADLLLLDPHASKGFYSVVQLVAREDDGGTWGEIIVLTPDRDITNIVWAAEFYQDMTGCV